MGSTDVTTSTLPDRGTYPIVRYETDTATVTIVIIR